MINIFIIYIKWRKINTIIKKNKLKNDYLEGEGVEGVLTDRNEQTKCLSIFISL